MTIDQAAAILRVEVTLLDELLSAGTIARTVDGSLIVESFLPPPPMTVKAASTA